MKKVLIVSYTLPPMSGVGARRWTKLSNQLVELGCEVHAISATPRKNESSPWILNDKINIVRLPNRYPYFLTINPKSFFHNLLYRLSIVLMKGLTKANYYDRAVLWESHFENHIYPYLVRNNIKNIIATGGPFSVPYYATALKEKLNDLHLWVDIRDEWGADEFYGFGIIGDKRQKEETRRLGKTLEAADLITVPYEYLSKKYSGSLKANLDKIKILPHGVDQIFENTAESGMHKMKKNKLKLVNFGSIHSGMDIVIHSLCRALKNIDVEINFYSVEKKYNDIFTFNKVGNKIKYNALVSEFEVAKIYKRVDAILMFIPKHFKDSITTKYMEIVASRKPILAIGCEGDVSQFIRTNKLGIFISQDKIEVDLPKIHEWLGNFNYNYNFDIEPYRFEELSKWVYQNLK